MPQTRDDRKDSNDLAKAALNCPGKVKWNPDRTGFTACCLVHSDKNPSLSVDLKDGRILAHCFAGCDQNAVAEALGIARGNGRSNVLHFNQVNGKTSGKVGRSIGHKAGQWTYETVSGQTVTVTRIEYQDGRKDFPNQPAGVKGPFLPLAWRQPGFDPAALIVVEGEKTAEAVRAALAEAELHDWSVTTWIGGSGAVGKTDWSSISGLKVILWPDADDAGRKAMQQVQAALPTSNTIMLANIKGLANKQDAADLQPADIAERIKAARPAPAPIQFLALSDVRLRPVDWIIPGWLPRGKITLLAGPPGAGKTTLAIKIASLITTGGKWADGTAISRGSVVGVFGEDDLADTVAPNFHANGADLERVMFANAASTAGSEATPFDPAEHLALLTETLRKRADVRLVIIDPAMAVARNAKDEYRAGDIRLALEPVQELAKEANVAVLGLVHFLKRHNSSGSGVLDRVSGSQAWTQVARMVWAADKTETGPTLMKVKANTSDSLGGFTYAIREIPLPVEFRGRAVPGRELTFGAPVAGDADAVFGTAKPEADRDAPARDAAREFLEIMFADQKGPTSWDDIEAEGKREGYKGITLRRARDQLRAERHIRSKKIGGKWFWVAQDAIE